VNHSGATGSSAGARATSIGSISQPRSRKIGMRGDSASAGAPLQSVGALDRVIRRPRVRHRTVHDDPTGAPIPPFQCREISLRHPGVLRPCRVDLSDKPMHSLIRNVHWDRKIYVNVSTRPEPDQVIRSSVSVHQATYVSLLSHSGIGKKLGGEEWPFTEHWTEISTHEGRGRAIRARSRSWRCPSVFKKLDFLSIGVSYSASNCASH